MSPKARRKRFPYGLTLAAAAAMAILCGLGIWQVQRLTWKEGLLAHVAALQGAAPRSVGPVLDLADAEFSRVELDCPGLGAKPFLELYAVRESGPGVRLISACALAGSRYAAILADRGFVSETTSSRPAIDPAARGPFHLIGILRRPDPKSFVTPKNELAANHWYSRDVPAMAKALKVERPAPLFLMAETSSNPEWRALNPAPLPAEISNRHLGYVITWFGLAGALACVYAASLWTWWKG